MIAPKPPKGIYVIAVVFFLTGMICIALLMPPIYVRLFGFSEKSGLIQQAGYQWVLVGGVLASGLVLYGVYALTRLHPAPQWAMVAMTLFMLFELVFASQPVDSSPFYSREQMIFNRFVLMLPLILSCAYLFRPGFRASCRELRARALNPRS